MGFDEFLKESNGYAQEIASNISDDNYSVY